MGPGPDVVVAPGRWPLLGHTVYPKIKATMQPDRLPMTALPRAPG